MRAFTGESGQLVEACLNCTLPFCNKEAAGCAYTITVRRWNGQDYQARKDYHAEYYQINRAKKLKAANERNAAKRS